MRETILVPSILTSDQQPWLQHISMVMCTLYRISLDGAKLWCVDDA